MNKSYKQDDNQERSRNHVQKFGHQKQQQLDTRILRVIPTNEFLLRFRKVKRQACRLGEGSHDEDQEP